MNNDCEIKTHLNTEAGSRLYYLDNLRIYLTVLVILHHASIAYGGSGAWAVKDPAVDQFSPLFLIFFTAVNQSYFMSAFFLLAGYFTPQAVQQKGPAVFLRDRLIRLGIPILVYTTLIINLNQFLLQRWMRGELFRWIITYQPGHLWFIQALLLFAILYLFYWAWITRGHTLQIFQIRPNHYPSNYALILSIIILSVLTFLVRVRFPVGQWVFPGFQLAHFVHYAFSFLIGIMAYRGDWLQRLSREQACRWGIIALVMLPPFFVVAILGGGLKGEAALVPFLGGVHWQSFAYAVWESTMFIAIITFLFYLFREKFNVSSRLLRSMAGSVYTVYIIHQTVVIAGNILLLPVHIPTIIKFVVVSVVAVPLCFGLAGLIRSIPGTGKVL